MTSSRQSPSTAVKFWSRELRRACTLDDKGNIEGSHKILLKIIAAKEAGDRCKARAYNMLAIYADRELSNINLAFKYVNEAIYHDAKFAAARSTLAKCYQAKGMTAKAKECYAIAHQLDAKRIHRHATPQEQYVRHDLLNRSATFVSDTKRFYDEKFVAHPSGRKSYLILESSAAAAPRKAKKVFATHCVSEIDNSVTVQVYSHAMTYVSTLSKLDVQVPAAKAKKIKSKVRKQDVVKTSDICEPVVDHIDPNDFIAPVGQERTDHNSRASTCCASFFSAAATIAVGATSMVLAPIGATFRYFCPPLPDAQKESILRVRCKTLKPGYRDVQRLKR